MIFRIKSFTVFSVAAIVIVLCSCAFVRVWSYAEYKGGYTALYAYVHDSMRYPPNEKMQGREAIVEVQFDVSKEGKPVNVQGKLIYGSGTAFIDEAVRLVRSMPAWEPAIKRNKPIEDRGNSLEIEFMLPDSLLRLPPPSDDTTVYTEGQVDSVAVYPGGDNRMYRFIYSNVRYPQMEKERGIMGTVLISYVVEKDGKVTNVAVVQEIPGGPGLTKESLRVVPLLRRHAPATKNGKAVRYRRTIPIKYTLM